MKKILLLVFAAAVLLSCNQTKTETQTAEASTAETIYADTVGLKTKSFDELFQSISPADIKDNVFKLVGQDYTVITAEKGSEFNSMTASFGGWGQLFEKPVTWCFLRANRYTLDGIKKEQTYTMTYFDDRFKDQVLYFGSKSGRDSDKMKETALTPVATPSGDMTYKEARLIIECKLMEVTTVDPKDFYDEDGRKFVEEGYADAKDYHKMVFGEITNVWTRK